MNKSRALLYIAVLCTFLITSCDELKVEEEPKLAKTKTENPEKPEETKKSTIIIPEGTTFSFANTKVQKKRADNTYTQKVENKATVRGDTGAITYASSDPAIATVDERTGEVTFVKEGEVTITATKAGTPEKYKPSTAQYTLIIKTKLPELTHEVTELTKTFTTSPYTHPITDEKEGGGAITYESSDTDIATVDENTGEVTFEKAGTVTMTATKNGVEASYTLTILASGTTLVFATPTATETFSAGGTYRQEVNKATTVPDDTGAITYESSDTTIATVDEKTGEVTFVKAGEVTITATKAGSDTYGVSTASYTLTIERAGGTTLDFATPTPPTQTFSAGGTYEQKVNKATTVADDTGAITYESSDPTIAKVNASMGEVTFEKAGEVTITATKAATDKYKASTAQYTLTIERAGGTTLAFDTPMPTETFSAGTYEQKVNKATTVPDDKGAITYESSDPTIAKVNASTGEVTFEKAGEVTITATKAATDKYKASTAQYTLTIERAGGTTLAFDTPMPTETFSADTYQQEVNKATTVADDTGAITYASSDTTIATVDEKTGEVTFVKAGEVTITATKAGSDTYGVSTASYTLTIERAGGTTLAFARPTPPTQTFSAGGTYEQKVNKATTVADDEGEITYTTSDPAIATVDNAGIVTFVKAGEVRITATKAATDKYKPSTAQYTLTIELGIGTTLAFASTTITKPRRDNTYTHILTKTEVEGDAGVISYTTSAPAIATVDNAGIVTFVHAEGGTVTITATKAATDKYKASTASYTLTIDHPDGSTIHYAEAEVQAEFHPPFTYTQKLTTPRSVADDTGEITYASSNADIATVNENTGEVTFVKAGEVTITATKAGIGTYKPSTAQYTLTIEPGSGTTLEFDPPTVPNPSKSFVEFVEGDSTTFDIDLVIVAKPRRYNTYTHPLTQTKVAGDEGEITYASSDDGIATVDNAGKVTFVHADGGTVIITATKAGTLDKYKPSTAKYKLIIYLDHPGGSTIEYEYKEVEREFRYPFTYTQKLTTPRSVVDDKGEITYTTSDTTIATVDTAGVVTMKKVDKERDITVTITATKAPTPTKGYLQSRDSYTLTITRFQPADKAALVEEIQKITNANAENEEDKNMGADLNYIDTSEISYMSNLFDSSTSGFGLSEFNGDISQWDVSSVTTMANMFNGATAFNSDISQWDVSSVRYMSFMFYGATAFNRDISEWKIGKVWDMSYMFYGATMFNQNLNAWESKLHNRIKRFDFRVQSMFYKSGRASSLPTWCQRPACNEKEEL